MNAIIINIIAITAFLIAFVKDRKKAIESLKIAGKSFINILPMVLLIIIIISLLLGFIPPEQIAKFIGEQSGIEGILFIGVVGAVTHIPALLSFPIAASLLEEGASVSAVTAFITTLTMIGIVTLPIEIKEIGGKIAILRNGLSFIIAIIIALIMGAIL